MTDDLAYHFIGPSVVAFGSPLGRGERCGPGLSKKLKELIIALARIAELTRCLGDLGLFALPFVEHGQAACNLVVLAHLQASARADQEIGIIYVFKHGIFLLRIVQKAPSSRRDDGVSNKI